MIKQLVFGVAIMALSSAVSAQEKALGSLTDVTGVWIMLADGHQVGLELEQNRV